MKKRLFFISLFAAFQFSCTKINSDGLPQEESSDPSLIKKTESDSLPESHSQSSENGNSQSSSEQLYQIINVPFKEIKIDYPFTEKIIKGRKVLLATTPTFRKPLFSPLGRD